MKTTPAWPTPDHDKPSPADGRCFILGAGFSRSCGFPLASELTWLVFHALYRKDPTDSRSPLAMDGDVVYPTMQSRLQAIKLLFPRCACQDGKADTWPDFEELITALDEAAKFEYDVQTAENATAKAWQMETRASLVRGLETLLGDRMRGIQNKRLDPIGYFLGVLDAQKDSIVSFNWDVLLELAAKNRSIELDGTSGPRLAKPHGSVDVVELSADEYQAAQGALNVRNLAVVTRYERCSERYVVLKTSDPRDVGNRTVAPFSRTSLVEPNLRKQYLSPWLASQWALALQSVTNARTIVIIGYSLPEADLRPRLLLRLAGVDRPKPRIEVVDPMPTAIASRVEAATGIAPVVHTTTWEEWIRQGDQST